MKKCAWIANACNKISNQSKNTFCNKIYKKVRNNTRRKAQIQLFMYTKIKLQKTSIKHLCKRLLCAYSWPEQTWPRCTSTLLHFYTPPGVDFKCTTPVATRNMTEMKTEICQNLKTEILYPWAFWWSSAMGTGIFFCQRREHHNLRVRSRV